MLSSISPHCCSNHAFLSLLQYFWTSLFASLYAFRPSSVLFFSGFKFLLTSIRFRVSIVIQGLFLLFFFFPSHLSAVVFVSFLMSSHSTSGVFSSTHSNNAANLLLTSIVYCSLIALSWS